MIWILAALMQLSTALVVESIQPNDIGVAIVLRNTTAKTITGFSSKQFNEDLRNTEGIAAGGTYRVQLLSEEPLEITGVVFSDGTYEGQQAKEILARREGIRQAEQQTARQVRAFLQFNTVIDDSALSVLDRELELVSQIPASLTDKEKASWNEGYLTARETTRKAIKSTPQDHRLEQLRVIGGGQ